MEGANGKQLELWDSERERKLTSPNTLRPVCRTKVELSHPREELASSGPAHPPPEAGGRGEGKGANSAPERASPTKLQTGCQSLTKLPEILGG